jgi:ABC-type sugar transport system permease subunit
MSQKSSEQAYAAGRPLTVWFAIAWNLVLAFGAIWLSLQIFNMETLTIFGKEADLGKPVQYFIAVLVLLPALLGFLSSGLMLLGKNDGRYLALTLNVGGVALAGLMLAGIWGFYQSFEKLVDMIMANSLLTVLGFALAYALFWLAGRLREESKIRRYTETLALGIGIITLIVILFKGTIGNPEFQQWHFFSALGYIASRYINAETALSAWGLSLAMLIFSALIWYLLHLGDYFGETTDQRNAWQGWLMLAPNIIGFSLFFAGPLLLSFYLSFTNSSVGVIPEFNWGEHYAKLFALEVITTSDEETFAQNLLNFGYSELMDIHVGNTRTIIGAKDPFFWASLFNTLKFCLFLLPLAVLPAIGIALILNSSLPGVKIFRAIYFLPSVAAVVGTALIWRWLYTPVTGYFDYVIGGIWTFFGQPKPEIFWLSDPNVVLFSVVILAAWQIVGYNTVLILAGLQGIPNTLYEAAQIDGANRVQQLWSVTLPMLQPTLFFVLITTMVTGLQVFNEPYALFPAIPIPEAARTSVYYMYTQGFQQFQFGYASAIAWVLFAIIFGLTLLQFRLNRGEAYE